MLPACDGGLFIDELNSRPVKQARTFAPTTCTQTLPLIGGQPARYLIDASWGLLSLHLYLFPARYRHSIGLLASLQHRSQRAMTPIDRIPCHPGRVEARVQRAREHAGGKFRFRRKADLGRHMRFRQRSGSWVQLLGRYNARSSNV